MQNKKAQLILLILVLFFLILLPGIFFRKRPAPGRTNIMEPQPQQRATVVKVQPSLPDIKETAGALPRDIFEMPLDLQKKFIQDDAELKEIEQDVEETDLPPVRLQGIIWGGTSPMAFIDDKVYKIGDNVSDAQITGIDKKGVYFLYHGKKVLMKVKSQM